MVKKNKKIFLSRMAESIVRAEEAKNRVYGVSALEAAEAYAFLQTETGGIPAREAERRRERYGANALPAGKKRGAWARFAGAFVNPFTLILLALAAVSAVTDIALAAPGEAIRRLRLFLPREKHPD